MTLFMTLSPTAANLPLPPPDRNDPVARRQNPGRPFFAAEFHVWFRTIVLLHEKATVSADIGIRQPNAVSFGTQQMRRFS
jgi:hypothetical protein